MLDYLDVLAELHVAQRPHSYLEIGVSRGDSFRLASDEAICVGVDPEPELDTDDPCRSNVEIMTSDEFFASGRLRDRFGERPVDMVFIDGMHLFEYALRDFTNAEAIAAPGSLIVLHDCLPRDAVTSSRERTTAHWTGDVWKLPLCLLDERPDSRTHHHRRPPLGALSRTTPRSGQQDAPQRLRAPCRGVSAPGVRGVGESQGQCHRRDDARSRIAALVAGEVVGRPP